MKFLGTFRKHRVAKSTPGPDSETGIPASEPEHLLLPPAAAYGDLAGLGLAVEAG